MTGARQPPLLSGGLPVLGHMVEFVRDAVGLLFRAYREHGEASRLRVAHRHMLLMFGPSANEAVFRAPDSVLNPQEAYKIMTPVFGKGLVYDAEPGVMGEQMKMLLVALKDGRMRTYGEAILDEVDKSVAPWGESGVIDLVDYCRVLTNFTSSRCLLGAEFRKGVTDDFARVYHDLERGVTPLAFLNPYLPIPSFWRRDRARVRLVGMISAVIEERRRTGRVEEDFLQTLMDVRYASGRPLTEDEITGLLLASMFAGHHTSSVTVSWTLIELLRNKPYLERVLRELDEVYADNRPVTYGSLREIPLTEHAVKETLRLHPPLFMLVRVARQDCEVAGWDVPAGSWVVASPSVSHMIPAIFRDPDRFDPDRFAPPREEDRVDYSYIPFGGGRHRCLGNAFALLQVKAILAVLLRRYDFELAGDEVRSDFHGLVVGPAEPCRVRYRRRAASSVRARPGKSAPSVATPARGCPFHDDAVATPPPHDAETVIARATSEQLVVEVDRDLCQGHAVCAAEAPAVFTIAADGKVALRSARLTDETTDAVRTAARHCPTKTIRLRTLSPRVAREAKVSS